MPDRRHQPRPSSAQWHAGLLASLQAGADVHADDPDPGVDTFSVRAAGSGPETEAGSDSGRGPGWFRVEPAASAVVDRLDRAELVGTGADARRYPVLDVRCAGDLVEVLVQPAAPETGLSLVVPVPAAADRYRDLLSGLQGPAAVKAVQPFARSVLDRLPATTATDSTLSPDDRAIAATRTAGLHVVWAPPTTSSVSFVAEALAAAIEAGQRSLFVSSDPLALDATLHALVQARRPASGQVIRVGPARDPELAENPRVAMAALTAAGQPGLSGRIDDQRRRVLDLREAEPRIAVREAHRRLTDFDPEQYRARAGRLATAAELAEVSTTLAGLEAEAAARSSRLEELEADLRRRTETLQTGRISEADAAVQSAQTALAAEQGGLAGWRRRRAAAAAARSAEQLAAGRRSALAGLRDGSTDPTDLLASTADVPAEITDLVDRRTAGRAEAETLRGRLGELRAERDRLAARPQPTADDAALVRAADEAGQPELAEKLPGLIEAARAADAELAGAGDELAVLLDQRQAASPGVEAGLLDRAGVVATTLDRLISDRALNRRRYGLVIVDQAAAAALPEVVFAAARASRSCVLVGDFLQPGPVVASEHRDDHYWDHDVFEHFGLTSARAAQHHPGCVLLAGRRALGPVIVDYLNAIAYQGVLERPRDGDPAAGCELVWIDVDGLPSSLTAIGTDPDPADADDPAGAAEPGRSWTAGARIAVAVAEQHRSLGQSVGVITPYPRQAEVIRAAFAEAGTDATGQGEADLPFVGTAADVGSRRFDVVVFDTVEDGHGWLAAARRDAVGPDADWARDGLRVVDAGVSRARSSVYLVASGRAMRGDRGTPMGELVQLCASGAVPRLSARRVLQPAPQPTPQPTPAPSVRSGVGVQDQGDGAVVDQADGHVGAEDAGLDAGPEPAQ